MGMDHCIANMFLIPLGMMRGEIGQGAKDGWSERRLERSDSKSNIPPIHITAYQYDRLFIQSPIHITNNLPLIASIIAGAPITIADFLLRNLLPVTLGNIVGCSLCVSYAFGSAFGKKK